MTIKENTMDYTDIESLDNEIDAIQDDLIISLVSRS